jgi:hypothetical protein
MNLCYFNGYNIAALFKEFFSQCHTKEELAGLY